MPPRDKISLLPPELRSAIDRMLIEAGFAGYEALEEAIRAEHGVVLGKSTIHRYGKKLESRLSAIRASTEAARAIAEAAPDDADHRSAAVISLVQSSLFDAMLALEEADDEADPADRVKLLANAARAIAEASRASQGQKKWAAEQKQKLDMLESAAGKGTKRLDLDTLKAVREALYGS